MPSSAINPEGIRTISQPARRRASAVCRCTSSRPPGWPVAKRTRSWPSAALRRRAAIRSRASTVSSGSMVSWPARCAGSSFTPQRSAITASTSCSSVQRSPSSRPSQ
ncbi:hypothetical protein SMICM304S_10837 [Streptomyces microflavus]